MKVEIGQLRWWTVGVRQGPFTILEYVPIGAGAWWVLTSEGRDWEPNELVEEFSKVIDETG